MKDTPESRGRFERDQNIPAETTDLTDEQPIKLLEELRFFSGTVYPYLRQEKPNLHVRAAFQLAGGNIENIEEYLAFKETVIEAGLSPDNLTKNQFLRQVMKIWRLRHNQQ